MLKIILQIVFVLFFGFVQSQNMIQGVVKNEASEHLFSASVFLIGTKHAAITDEKGKYVLENVPSGDYTMKVTYLGYDNFMQEITVANDQTIDVSLNGVIFGLDEIQIKSTWVDQDQPFAFSSMDQEEIQINNLGQDVPYLLKWLPSTVVSSDAGAGVGYTGMRIRGTDPTRINVTINGIPLNDAESHNVFWVDLPDFLSSVNQIQIQRGVGTSTNGASAFGASINLNTLQSHVNAYARLSGSVGSFNTLKYSAEAGTGLMNDRFSIDARVSKITSDGYIDRASSDLNSIYFSAARVAEESSLKLIAFHGSEVTYQAWNGLPIQLLETDRTFNPSGTEKGGEPHDNEVDDYDQTHIQLLYDRSINNSWLMNLGLHYTAGQGFFEQYKADQNLLDYGLPNDLGDTELIRRRWLDNDFFGGIASIQKTSKDYTLTMGGAYNIYKGRHFGEVIWTGNSSSIPQDHTYYDNDATKKDANAYLKIDYNFSTKFKGFTDFQVRSVGYEFLGFDADLNNVTQSERLNFFNPKLGFTFLPNKQSKVFASVAVANKEPNRNDYTESSPTSRPLHESLYDLEVGYSYTGKNIAASVNLYNMMYDNQLVQTGQINDVGASVRENVESSFRRGLELQLSWQISDWLEWSTAMTVSQNKIENYTTFLDDWDTGNQVQVDLGETDLALSPALIASSQLSISLGKLISSNILSESSLSLMHKYVGEQYIDNTSLEASSLPDYAYTDLRFHWPIPVDFAKRLSLTCQINNVFNALYVANAWIYRFNSAGYNPVADEPYAVYEGGETYNLTGLFPQAERNFMLGLSLEF